ncbi:MAG: helix-turn-helix transcriptional regulator, partial [Nitrospirae bacterium]|nr:helix-turn-helix transcriptional regulator [Nitrospirota bacterium]
MDNFYKIIGERIKKIREEIGLSQQALAKKICMNRVSLSQIENGQRVVSAEEITKLAKIFNISSDMLLDLEQEAKIVIKEDKEKVSQRPTDQRLSGKINNELRIDVPQKNFEKLKQILLYILKRVGSKP